MKLYSVILPLIIFGLFGYTASVLERTQVDGAVEKDAVIERVKKDYENVDEFMKTGTTANHGKYND